MSYPASIHDPGTAVERGEERREGEREGRREGLGGREGGREGERERGRGRGGVEEKQKNGHTKTPKMSISKPTSNSHWEDR